MKANTAVEGYVFLALLARHPVRSVEPLGRWTQTSTKPAPLPRAIFEQERRCMLGQCFNCGSRDHAATRCPKALETTPYTCPSCQQPVLISTRGASCPGSSSGGSSSGQRRQVASPPPSMPSLQRKAAPLSSGKPFARRAKTSARGGQVLLVGGKHYTSFSWFLNSPNPSKKMCAVAKEQCYKNAVEMRNGNVNTMSPFAWGVACGAPM